MENQGNSSKILFIVNVFAASKKAGAMWERAVSLLNTTRIAYHKRLTGRNGNAMELAYDACVCGYRKIVAVGGDGTVHDVLNGIMQFVAECTVSGHPLSLDEFTIGVLPVGSGNDWIKSHGIPSDFSKAIEVIAAGRTVKQDVVRVSVIDAAGNSLSDSYMANVGGVGLDARVCERVNRNKERGRRGKKLYVSALLYHLFHRKPVSVKLVCDDRTVYEGPYLSIAFGIGKYSGGGMRQTPSAVPDDGFLDVTLIPELPVMKIAKEAPKLFTGTFDTVPERAVAKCRSVTVIPEKSAKEPVEVDGEVIGTAPVRLEVIDKQINVFAP